MTFDELKSKYIINNGTTEESFRKNWKRNQDRFFRDNGVHLVKKGRSPHITYYIEEEEYFYTNKAFVNDWDGTECRSLVTTDLILTNEELYCLLVVLFAPMGVFRGTYDTFITYAEIGRDKLEIIKQAIAALVKKGYMEINIDTSTAEGYFTLISKRYIERDCLPVPLDKIRKIIAIAKANNTRSWIPIFKMWAAVSTLDGEISTSGQLAALTGLTERQVCYYGKMLKDSGVISSNKKFVGNGNDVVCIGTEKTVAADWSWLD